MMKILIMANSIVGEDPNLTGGEMRFIEIAKRWKEQGHEIHLLSSFAADKLCAKFGLKIDKLHVLSKSAVSSRPIFLLRMLQSLFFLPASLETFDEGIVYSANEQLYDVLPALRIKLKNKAKIKWAVVVHWLPPWPPWKRKQSKVLNSLLFFISERLSVRIADRYADRLMAVSDSTKKQLEAAKKNMEKAHSVACGVDYPLFQKVSADIVEKKYDAVFMKRLMTVKGVFDIIDVWEDVIKKKPGARMLIVGEGCDEAQVKDMVRDRGLSGNIDFISRIHDVEEKVKAIASGRVFVLPSYEENWCISAGEAMACGVPVVAYRLEALVDVWGDSIIMVEVGDKKAFADEVMKLLNDETLEKEVGKRGADYVARYDWNVIAKKEMKLITGSKNT